MKVIRITLSQLFAIFAIHFMLVSFPAIAEEHKEIIFSMGGGWPPYLIVDSASGQLIGRGILMEIINEIVGQSKYTLKIVAYPEKRDVSLLDKGLIDFRIDGKKWVDHPDSYYWSDTIIESEDVLIFRSDRQIHFEQLHDLVSLKIITHLVYTYPTLDHFFRQALFFRLDAPNHLSMLNKLKHARGDAVIMNKNVALWIIRENKQFSITEFSFSNPVDATGVALLFKDKKWLPFIQFFNRRLAEIKLSGALSKILKKYN